MTVDEELNILETQLRRLKIEYEMYFSNPTKKPPTDVEWKVLSLLRKFSDGGRLNFSQRFRYNELAQRYAIYSDLWRKKGRIREEGCRRPQDALLSVQGARSSEARKTEYRKVYGLAHGGAAAAAAATAEAERLTFQCSDPELERQEVEKLFRALVDAKQKAGEASSGNFDNFHTFVRKKTEQIRKQYGCPAVEYTVETQNGQVRLKAKAKA
ncbi:MAG TPA: MXAN_5187 C-terminal domain-containing protein [Terriglobales bacterium]|nr:MXAN_5187 C-terminal domain-containing protein [Terriglobales bacterium]